MATNLEELKLAQLKQLADAVGAEDADTLRAKADAIAAINDHIDTSSDEFAGLVETVVAEDAAKARTDGPADDGRLALLQKQRGFISGDAHGVVR